MPFPRVLRERDELGRLCLGFDWNGSARCLLEVIGGLGLNECEQPFVFLGRSQELEGDSAWANRSYHRSDLQRLIPCTGRNLQIKDVIDAHLRFALDDAAAHREIQHGSLAADLASREREIEPDGNSEMLTPINRVAGMI